MIEQIKGVDCLYHEATFILEDESKALETQHSTAQQAASIARQANVGKLLLGHFSARYKELTEVLNEATPIFANTVLALEGETFTIAE
jgi:ribonuclease Z